MKIYREIRQKLGDIYYIIILVNAGSKFGYVHKDFIMSDVKCATGLEKSISDCPHLTSNKGNTCKKSNAAGRSFSHFHMSSASLSSSFLSKITDQALQGRF